MDDQTVSKLADHPEEKRLRHEEVLAASTLLNLARKASRALREHRRHDAVVLCAQLAGTAELLHKAQQRAIQDQMDATHTLTQPQEEPHDDANSTQ